MTRRESCLTTGGMEVEECDYENVQDIVSNCYKAEQNVNSDHRSTLPYPSRDQSDNSSVSELHCGSVADVWGASCPRIQQGTGSSSLRETSCVPSEEERYRSLCNSVAAPKHCDHVNAQLQQPQQQQQQQQSSMASYYQKMTSALLTSEQSINISKYCLQTLNAPDMAKLLCSHGDDIISDLVGWLKQLPFSEHLTQAVQMKVLGSRWHELLLLITTAHQARVLGKELSQLDPNSQFNHLMQLNMGKLHGYIDSVHQQELNAEGLHPQVLNILRKLTLITHSFHSICLSQVEYVCLKASLLLQRG